MPWIQSKNTFTALSKIKFSSACIAEISAVNA